MDERGLQQRERRALRDTLETVGGDAPTMCDGWDAHDLAAHLVVRERNPWTAPVIICGVRKGVIHRMTMSERPEASARRRPAAHRAAVAVPGHAGHLVRRSGLRL